MVVAGVLGDVSPSGLKVVRDRGGLIVDIRREEEWLETGVIEGCELVTAFTVGGEVASDFEVRFFGLLDGFDGEVVLYCRSGRRTGVLGGILVERFGLRCVSHLGCGILGWLSCGELVVPYDGRCPKGDF